MPDRRRATRPSPPPVPSPSSSATSRTTLASMASSSVARSARVPAGDTTCRTLTVGSTAACQSATNGTIGPGSVRSRRCRREASTARQPGVTTARGPTTRKLAAVRVDQVRAHAAEDALVHADAGLGRHAHERLFVGDCAFEEPVDAALPDPRIVVLDAVSLGCGVEVGAGPDLATADPAVQELHRDTGLGGDGSGGDERALGLRAGRRGGPRSS